MNSILHKKYLTRECKPTAANSQKVLQHH